jgi:hypothetical protein
MNDSVLLKKNNGIAAIYLNLQENKSDYKFKNKLL